MSIKHEKLEQMAESAAVWIGSLPSLFVHTLVFVLMFALHFLGVPISNILLIATTIVSFEAIYLNIFVQMTVNKHSKHLKKHSELLEHKD
jgi:hypothetical protein